jgi:peptidoglycan hydrolase CwlO-like protein
MRKNPSSAALVSCLVAGLMAVVPTVHAQSSDNDLLRRTQMQLRQSEQERNSLRGELARLQAQVDGQMAEMEKARQQVTQAQSAQNSAATAELSARASKAKQLSDTLQVSLQSKSEEVAKLRADNARQAQALQNVQAMLQQAQQSVGLRDELVDLFRTRNQELYKVGTELVALYRNKDMDSLVKREPVLQIQQVKLQNLMQDYEDRLRTSRVYPDTLPPSVEKAMQENLRKDAQSSSGKPAPARAAEGQPAPPSG